MVDHFEEHVRASCRVAEDLASRIDVDGAAALFPRIRRAWIEAEMPSRCPEAWARIWRAVGDADPARVMSARELRALEDLPTTVTAYRGFCGDGARGWSWTPEREIAEDFAVRYDEPAFLCAVTVGKDAIIVYLLDGDESELILDPELIDWDEARIEAVEDTDRDW
ncbi:hypothetical protein [Corynebacterium sp.]|uniref:hypothetical protein n=1 Tax=Corynebacterium sp. TaxID=1720 RepID=UPI0026E0CAB6|nr:hypothetical protein [Corynebacterium sp.]MDO5513462.1 hypothetical protein [Corynebacterium sp.]